MTKLLIILLVALVFEAAGVVFLKVGLDQIGEVKQVTLPEIGRVIGRGIANRNVLFGVFFEALFFAGLLILMSQGDISFIWPLTSLGFVITTLAALCIRHEHVSGLRWGGVVLIMVGAALITWSEKAKAPLSPKSAAAAEASITGQ